MARLIQMDKDYKPLLVQTPASCMEHNTDYLRIHTLAYLRLCKLELHEAFDTLDKERLAEQLALLLQVHAPSSPSYPFSHTFPDDWMIHHAIAEPHIQLSALLAT